MVTGSTFIHSLIFYQLFPRNLGQASQKCSIKIFTRKKSFSFVSFLWIIVNLHHVTFIISCSTRYIARIFFGFIYFFINLYFTKRRWTCNVSHRLGVISGCLWWIRDENKLLKIVIICSGCFTIMVWFVILRLFDILLIKFYVIWLLES